MRDRADQPVVPQCVAELTPLCRVRIAPGLKDILSTVTPADMRGTIKRVALTETPAYDLVEVAWDCGRDELLLRMALWPVYE